LIALRIYNPSIPENPLKAPSLS